MKSNRIVGSSPRAGLRKRPQRRLRAEHLEARLVLSANATPLDDFVVAANDNTFFNAAEIGFVDDSITVFDQVGRRDRNDYVQFVVRRDATLDVSLTGLSGDVDIDLFDGRRRRIDRGYTRGVVDESISQEIAAGEYYVRVRSRPAVESNYFLSIDVSLAAPPAQFDFVPDFGSSDDWGLNSINAPEVWNAGYTGAGVTVAVVDSGVDWTHSDLAGSIWQNPGEIAGDGIDNDNNGFIDDVRGWDFVQDDADPNDGGTHGTHVAGIVGAARDSVGSTGVAYGADIMPIRVLDSSSGSYADVARGIRYAVDNGADVINLSLGGGYNGLVYSALQHAAANDVFVVAAAGNDNFARPGFPARHSMQLENVLSVGSHTVHGTMSSFSNGAIGVRDVQVDAPGSSLLSTLPAGEYGFKSGTSMAAPHVAGIAALMLSANGDLDAAQVRDLIVAGASEYIVGNRPSGGVNASVSVYAAAQTTGLAMAASVASGVTATTVVDDGQSMASTAEVSSQALTYGSESGDRRVRVLDRVAKVNPVKSVETGYRLQHAHANVRRGGEVVESLDGLRVGSELEQVDAVDDLFAEWGWS